MSSHPARPPAMQEFATALQGRTRRELQSLPGRRDAAVLVPIFLEPAGPSVLLTLRTNSLPTHKGQVAFPGGGTEQGDVDAVATALRETEEEVGLPPSLVDVLGLGDDVFSITGQRVTPVVGLVHRLPELAPNPGEIADVFHVTLADLQAPGAFYENEMEGPDGKRRIPFIQGGKHQIWGLTAWVLKELLGVLDGSDGGRFNPTPMGRSLR